MCASAAGATTMKHNSAKPNSLADHVLRMPS